jgi:hypothetical protein
MSFLQRSLVGFNVIYNAPNDPLQVKHINF